MFIVDPKEPRAPADELVMVMNAFDTNFDFGNPTGTSLVPAEYTDTISQVQGQRGILELKFPYPGKYMFHAHKTEFAELGWMGFFEVVD